MPNRETFVALQNETYVMRKEEVEALIQTTTLSRKAILSKLSVKKKNNNSSKKKGKKNKEEDIPMDVKEQDYSEVDIEEEDDSI